MPKRIVSSKLLQLTSKLQPSSKNPLLHELPTQCKQKTLLKFPRYSQLANITTTRINPGWDKPKVACKHTPAIESDLVSNRNWNGEMRLIWR